MKLNLEVAWLVALAIGVGSGYQQQKNLVQAASSSLFGALSEELEDEGPSIGAAESLGDSQPLTMLPYADPIANNSKRVEEEEEDRGFYVQDTGNAPDGALQTDYSRGIASFETTMKTFEGVSIQDVFNAVGFSPIPPDPAIAVGPTQVVEMTNGAYQVYDKMTGNGLLEAPMALANIWTGGDECNTSDGDPIALFDKLHGRWVLMQFAVQKTPFHLCFAVSETEDATGRYHLFKYSTGLVFPDYPKMGLWRDKLVVTTVDFGLGYTGVSVFAFNLDQMTNGVNPKVVKFTRRYGIYGSKVGWGLLPADVDGEFQPDADAAIVLVGSQDDHADFGATSDGVNIWELRVDFENPKAATLEHIVTLEAEPFDSIMECAPSSLDCVPQRGTSQKLDQDPALQRFLHRFAYRRFLTPVSVPTPAPAPVPDPPKGWYLGYWRDRLFGTNNDLEPVADESKPEMGIMETSSYESFVTNVSVEARAGIVGPRWYEIRRDSNGNYAIHQQGTFSPDDGVSRFYGSMAQDKYGNIALGYSVTGERTYPGIRATGRTFDAPLGEMNLVETSIVEGGGSQTGGNRWGDYSAMVIDPSDDCTFWYCTQYQDDTENRGWKTKIAAFNFGGDCASPENA